MMTEEEARAKWCPMARVVTKEAGYNRFGNGDLSLGASCIASDCAMWRVGAERTYIKTNNYWDVKNPPEGWEWVETFESGLSKFRRTGRPNEVVGYCGLAGRPEVG